MLQQGHTDETKKVTVATKGKYYFLSDTIAFIYTPAIEFSNDINFLVILSLRLESSNSIVHHESTRETIRLSMIDF